MTNNMANDLTGLEISVIGISARFPNAVNIHQYWENLKNGLEGISFFSEEELIQEGYAPGLVENPAYVKAKGVMEDIEYFDSSFFDYSSREAEIMDPQMRIFHELAWEALEDAAYAPTNFKGLIGLYAGAAHNHPWIGLSAFSGKAGNIGQWAADQLVDKGYLTMRVSYKLNLRGPSYSMYTACSTSLVAVHLACQAILNGECDMALAGGITITLPNKTGHMYQEGMIMSPDGHCRVFDVDADGTVVGNGAGIVVLKRLEDALAHNDYIYAVIKGSAINNDGIRKSGFTAPSVEGQVEAIRTAQQMAGVKPESITYIEAHGTGTAIGDPIEIEALSIAFNTPKRNFCAISAVKSNIGHLDAAAGIAGFIKAVLALKHREIPPSLHYKNPNPQIDFENSPFYINTTPREWKNEKYPLRAGVSSFGIGGTNAHVILEEAPEGTGGLAPLSNRQHQLILLSAKSETALQQITKNLANYLENNPANPNLTLTDIVYTLHVGREAFKYRKALIAADIEEACRLLSASTDPSSPHFAAAQVGTARDKNRLVFMFSGQGSQYVNMGRGLYENEPIFRKEMDHCFEILKPLMDYDIKEIIYPSDRSDRSDQSDLSDTLINQTQITQPVIFAFEYAIAKLLMNWGIKPYAMIGHSIGEYTAACLSGVFSLEDGLQLAVQRGKLMQQMPPGAMLSVSLPEKQIQSWLDQYPGLALAAVNAPSLCVVSGPQEIIKTLANQLEANEIQCRPLHTSHAFHSPMMDPVLIPFENIVRKITLNQPQVPYISNVTGKWIAIGDAVDPAYWAKHLRSTVQFSAGLTPLLQETNSIFIEIGPGRSLETFVKKHVTKDTPPIKVLNLVKHPKEETPDSYYLLSKIAQLWLNGEMIDPSGFYAGENRRRLPLPTYPFERKKYWLEAKTSAVPGQGLPGGDTVLKKRANITDWFYTPSWKRSLPPKPGYHPHSIWLLFMDEIGIGEQLLQQLSRLNAQGDENESQRGVVLVVRAGESFTNPAENTYTVNPREPGDYQALIAQLKEQKKLPNRVVHLWNFMPLPHPDSPEHQNEAYDDRGFYSLIYLAQAIGKEEIETDTKILVVTNNMQEVSGGDLLCPRSATVLGPAAVISREYPNINCCCLDVVLPSTGSTAKEPLVDWLQAECTVDNPYKENGEIIAYRNGYRWVQTFEPLPLPPLAHPTEKIPRLKQKGVYLITGGTGGMGLVLAQYLAKTTQARLILTSRSPLPGKEEWNQWLNSHLPQDNTSEIIRKIQEMETAGAEIMHFSADVTDETQMKEVITRAGEKWPPINGVIYAAGIPGGGLIQLKDQQQAENVMLPKVKGTLVLNKLLENHPLDFLILCSSINSIIPFMGQVDYYAANAFLDAFAYYKSSRNGIFTVSINWDTWQEVGMAVKAAKQLTHRKSPQRETPGSSSLHPLLDDRIHKDPQKEIYVTHFKLSQHWVLNEHKVMESGKGLIPGVTYLEMAREAFAQHTDHGSKPIEINEIYFLNPLMVGENEEIETRFILEKQDNTGEYEFLVQSRKDENDENWQKHAVGKIKALEVEESIRHEIKAIEAKCNKNEIVLSQTGDQSQRGLLYFGPRWGSINRVLMGEKQGLAFMQLDDAFTTDLDSYKLHPALLDSAAGFLFTYIYPGSAYIPFAYKKIRVKGPLPAKIISCSRLIEDSPQSQKETLKFDVTIMDQQGRELVDIKEFTMLEVSQEVKKKINTPPTAAAPPHKEKENVFLKDGILPQEGVDVFSRILSGALPQVVVSTLDLPRRIKSNRAAPSKFLVEEIEKSKPTGPKDERPEISTVYVAPITEIEQTVANVWQEILGINKVGTHDDFFELGGDSLNIVQLNGLLKKQLKRDIPVAVLFRHLNIHSFVQYLEQQGENKNTPEQKEYRSKIIKESKDRLKERVNRRTSRR